MNILSIMDNYIKLAQQRVHLLQDYSEPQITNEENIFGVIPKTKEQRLNEFKDEMEGLYSEYRFTCKNASQEDLTAASIRANKIVEDLTDKLTSLVQRKEWAERRENEQRSAGITISASQFEESAIELKKNIKDTEVILAFYKHFRDDLSSIIEQAKTKKANL